MVLRGQGFKEAVAGGARARRKSIAAAADAEGLAGRLHNQSLPDLRFEMRDPESLRVPTLNVKKTSAAQVARVGRAIAQLEYVAPVLITPDGEIVDGVSSVEAAKRLGLREVPVIVAAHMNTQAISLARMALNRLPARAEWDIANLKIAFDDLLQADVSIEIAVEPPEIDAILLGDEPAISKRDNQALSPDAVTGLAIPSGSLWALGRHRLLQGDARDPAAYERLLAGTAVRLVLTDVPYNVGADIVPGLRADRQGAFVMAAGEMSDEAFVAFLTEALGAGLPHLLEGGLVYSFIDWRHLSHLVQAARELGLTQINMAVWVKSQAGMGSLYRSQHERVGMFKKGSEPTVNNVGLGRHGRDRTNVWTYPGANTAGSSTREGLADHPTPKCVEMLADAMLDVTQRGDAVLDPSWAAAPRWSRRSVPNASPTASSSTLAMSR